MRVTFYMSKRPFTPCFDTQADIFHLQVLKVEPGAGIATSRTTRSSPFPSRVLSFPHTFPHLPCPMNRCLPRPRALLRARPGLWRRFKRIHMGAQVGAIGWPVRGKVGGSGGGCGREVGGGGWRVREEGG